MPHNHSPRRRRALVTVLSVGVLLPFVATPASAQESDEASCPDTAPSEAQTEFEAVSLAELCDAEVEIVDEQTPWGTSVARPDGTVALSAAIEPFRARDESGEWAPIDLSLEGASDGSVRPVNAVSDMVFSGGGSGALASMADGERSFSLNWLEELPEPELSGPSATYPEVLEGVDLVVTASAEGFSHDLVVKSAEAASNPALDAVEFGFAASGLDAAVNAEGGIELIDDTTGELFAGAVPPSMWDASAAAHDASMSSLGTESSEADAAVNDPARVAAELEDSTLRLVPDQGLLEGPDTVYPVTIDPVWAPDTNGWTAVSTLFPSNSYWKTSHLTNKSEDGDAGVGRSCRYSWDSSGNCHGEEFRMRSYFRFDTSTVTQDGYRIPRTAEVSFLQRRSGFCDEGRMNLYKASYFDSARGTSWNTDPTAYASTLVTTSSADHDWADCGGDGWVGFNVTDIIDSVNASGDKHAFFALRAPDESPSPDLKYWNRFDGDQAQLEIVYDIMPYYPKDLRLDGAACTSNPAQAPWVTNRRPELSARISTKDSSVRWQARVRESGSGGDIEFDWTSGNLADDYRRSVTVDDELPDDSYYWLARSISTSNSSIKSSWSPACRFNVDATKPTTPEVNATEGPFSVGDTIQLSFSSTDPEVNGISSGLDFFEYSWQTNTYDQTLDAGHFLDSSGLTAGRHVLYVRAVDVAGNRSNSRTFTFFVGSDIEATPMATWRFEGDTFDDTGHGFDLNPIDGGAHYEADRDGRADSALTLDGNTCLSTDDGDPDNGDAVVRTDAAFSISAWVRLDAASGYDKALVQAGSEHSAFQLQYSSDADKWYFSMLSAPGLDFEWRSVGADATAAPGEWQHVAGTYDPDAGLTRIYIDGQLGGELPVSFTPWHEEHVTGLGCLLNASGETSNHVTGAIDQVGIWQGLLTPEQIQASMVDLPTASEQAHWEFRDGGTDETVYGRDLDIPTGVTVGEDAYQRPSGAVELDGSTCLEYPEPAVATDRSFTTAGWVKLDLIADDATVVSIAGDHRPGLRIRYVASVGKWQFAMHGVDAPQSESSWLTVLSDAAVEQDRWYHLSAVYDAAENEMRLFVDGALQGTRAGPDAPWAASGATVVGCSANGATNRWSHLTGSLHDVRLWRGPVDADQISGMMGDPPAELAAWWGLDANGDDWSDHGRDLTLVDEYSWTDGWWGNRDGAFALEFGGGGYAHSTGAVLPTDESFTISAWVRPEELSADGVAVSITGADRSVITLKHSVANASWEFAAPPTADLGWRTASSTSAPVAGEWVFLVGVFDLAQNELRLYVNGQLAGTATEVVMPASEGRLVIGAEGNADGTVRLPLVGAVDEVIVWTGAVPESTITEMSPESVES